MVTAICLIARLVTLQAQLLLTRNPGKRFRLLREFDEKLQRIAKGRQVVDVD